jgi:hypothetical protein
MRRGRLIGCVLRGAAFVVMMQTANLDHGTLSGEFSTYGNKRNMPLVSDAASVRRVR